MELASRRAVKVWLGVLLLSGWASGAAAQQMPHTNPYTTQKDLDAGARLYRPLCAGCHGFDAGGAAGEGPDIQVGSPGRRTDAEVYETIRDGIRGTSMPGWNFSEKERWQVVGYLQLLRRAGGGEQTAGDPRAGAAIFRGEGGCQGCHVVHGQGGRRGPDLSAVGRGRSPEELEASILNPNGKVSPAYWRVRAWTIDGGTLAGRRLNEDTFSLQLLDSDERLVSVMKSDLKKFELLKDSAMPSYEGKLSRQKIDDLVAYLSTLGVPGAGR